MASISEPKKTAKNIMENYSIPLKLRQQCGDIPVCTVHFQGGFGYDP